MSKIHNGTFSDWAKLGYIEVDGKLVKAKSVAAKKVEKIKLPPDFVIFSNIGTIDANGKIEPIFPKPNAKIKNATKSVNSEGIKFDSNLEKYMYGLLRGAGIDFQFQKEYLLQEKFRYGTEAIRAISLTVDFYLPGKNMIIDTKGMQTQQGAIRWKLLKLQLVNKNIEFELPIPKIEMPSNKTECETLLNRILYEP